MQTHDILFHRQRLLPISIRRGGGCSGCTARAHTEPGIKACTWLREISSCSCLTVLPGPAWLLLTKICIPFFRALYMFTPRRRRLPLPSHRLVVLSPYSSLSPPPCPRAAASAATRRFSSLLLSFGSVRPYSHFLLFLPVFPSVAFGRRVVSDASHPSLALSPKSRSFVRVRCSLARPPEAKHHRPCVCREFISSGYATKHEVYVLRSFNLR